MTTNTGVRERHTLTRLALLSVTGASSGFGHILSEVALEKGDLVVATARRPSTLADLVAKYPADRLLTLKLDITKPEDVRAAFSAIEAKFGRIDVVVNNAGYAIAGEAEGVRDDSDARAMFETNFWGTAHVTTEAVRFLREVNPPGVGGKIFQISSLSGVVGKPGMTYYSASKFGTSRSSSESPGGMLAETDGDSAALGGYSEALAGELDPAWNIKVSRGCQLYAMCICASAPAYSITL